MFDGLIEGNMARAVAESVGLDRLTELRLRVNRALLAMTSDTLSPRLTVRQAGKPYIVTREDIDGIISRATNMSYYSVSDELIRGYIPFKSLRIGVGGEGVSEGGRLMSVKNIGYLVIRVPHQVRSAADGVIKSVLNGGKVRSTLIASPPRGGKTTMLRELARRLSANFNVAVIDERYELAASVGGIPTLDIGDADVISGVKKSVAYENCVRALSPDVIVTDELFGVDEIAMICDVMRSGVKALASVHAASVKAISESEIFKPLLERFEQAIVLATSPVGSVTEVKEL